MRTDGDADASEEGSRPRRILLVDDDVEFVQVLGAVLETAGYEVQVTFDAAAALALTANFTPDFAIVDIHMPVVDGYALLAIFRAEPTLRRCVLIAVSGSALDQPEAARSFQHFFTKPLHVARLIELLDSSGS